MRDHRTKHAAEGLEADLGYVFKDKKLLKESLTHKSFHHENREKAPSYNERLEFLGDSVIGLIIVEYLFLLQQGYSESVLAKMKSYLASETVFADIARSLSLNSYLLLGKGEESTGGGEKNSILANALEAVIGAVYIDAGYEKTREMVLRFFKDRIDRAVESGEFYDYKTELQEKTQLLCGLLPEYRVVKEQGEEHKRIFTVEVYLDNRKLGIASGKRKKEAEALAAKKAIEKLNDAEAESGR
ncbi:MAG: ribonuclease III [Nitrospirae bacterium]|nr:ribonuclease III [Nitrospirota bacterium]